MAECVSAVSHQDNSSLSRNVSGPSHTPFLRTLLVDWILSENECHPGSKRHADGTRGDQSYAIASYDHPLPNPYFPVRGGGRQSWIEPEELALEPLKDLRGLKKAIIMGCVTEDWALWLEQRMMMSNDDANMDQFVRKVIGAVAEKYLDDKLAKGREWYHETHPKYHNCLVNRDDDQGQDGVWPPDLRRWPPLVRKHQLQLERRRAGLV